MRFSLRSVLPTPANRALLSRRYFLLTPKLLPDLEYHPLMKVLVIQAGTWLPDKLSLADVVKRRLKRKAAAIAT